MAITKDSIKQITDLSVRIFKQCDQNGENEIISPLSLFYVLAMIEEGADGNTLAQIENLVSVKADDFIDILQEYQQSCIVDKNERINVANALVVDDSQGIQLKSRFLKRLSASFAPQFFRGKGCVDEINQWADEETFGMIKKLCSKLPENLSVVLLNAVAFDQLWLEPYFDEDIYDEDFTNENSKKEKVTMMHSTERGYFEDDNAVGFVKRYQRDDYEFLAILPDLAITLTDYIQTLTGKKLSRILNKIDFYQSVKAAIPVFTTDFKIDMGEALQQMGITDAFDARQADLSRMGTLEVKGENLYINGIQQTAHITVDRAGTRAAAVTEIPLEGIPDFSEPKEVYLDRPFLYMIIDKKYNFPVFIGTVRNKVNQ